MSAEPAAKPPAPGARTSRIECNLDNDPRLLASVETIVAHAAGRAGFSEDAQREVAVAAANASREMAVAANGNGNAAATTRLIVDEFPDRLELTFESPESPNPEGMRKRLEGNANDRIRCELREGAVRVTLLKSCGAAKSGSAC